MATPANVATSTKHFGELALVIKQAGIALRHLEWVTEFLHQCGQHDAAEDGDDNYEQNVVVHAFSPF